MFLVPTSDDESDVEDSDCARGYGGVFLVPTSDDESDVEGSNSLLRVLRDGTVSSKERGEKQALCAGASVSGESSPNEGMVSRDEAEATLGDLVNPLGVQAERKKNKGKRKPAGSSCA